MKRAGLVAVLVALFGVTSCAGPDTSAAKTSAVLLSEIAKVRVAANARDVTSARARLDDIRRTVATLRTNGQLSDAGAGRILIATDAVQSDLSLISPPATTVPPPTSTRPTVPAPPPPGAGHGKKGHGKAGDD